MRKSVGPAHPAAMQTVPAGTGSTLPADRMATLARLCYSLVHDEPQEEDTKVSTCIFFLLSILFCGNCLNNLQSFGDMLLSVEHIIENMPDNSLLIEHVRHASR